MIPHSSDRLKSQAGTTIGHRLAAALRHGAAGRGRVVAALVALSLISVAAVAAPPDITGMWTYRFRESQEKVSSEGMTDFGRKFVLNQQRATEMGHVRRVANMKCLPSGFPALMQWRSPIQIMQGFGRLAIITEHDPGNDEPRTIYLDRPQSSDVDPSWNGHSVGRWEGSTLVIDTVALNGRESFRFPLTQSTHVVERLHLESKGQLLVDEFTFYDPAVFTSPYKMTLRFDRMASSNERMEAVCEPDLDAIKATDLPAIREVDAEAARMLDPELQYNSAENAFARKSSLK